MKKNERKMRRRKSKQRRQKNTGEKTKRRDRVINLASGPKRLIYHDHWTMEDGKRCYHLGKWNGNIFTWCLDAQLRLFKKGRDFRVEIEEITRLMLGKAIVLNSLYQTLKAAKKVDAIEDFDDEFFEEVSNHRNQFLNENGIPSHYFADLGETFKDFDGLYDEMLAKLCNQSEEWLTDCFIDCQEMGHEQILVLCSILEVLEQEPPFRNAI